MERRKAGIFTKLLGTARGRAPNRFATSGTAGLQRVRGGDGPLYRSVFVTRDGPIAPVPAGGGQAHHGWPGVSGLVLVLVTLLLVNEVSKVTIATLVPICSHKNTSDSSDQASEEATVYGYRRKTEQNGQAACSVLQPALLGARRSASTRQGAERHPSPGVNRVALAVARRCVSSCAVLVCFQGH